MGIARHSPRMLFKYISRYRLLVLALLLLSFFIATFFLINLGMAATSDRIADVFISDADAMPRATSITSLPRWLSTQTNARAAFDAIFELSEDAAPLTIPSMFRAKALAMFSSYGGTPDELVRALETQRVVDVRNRATGDAVSFNSVRRFRPGGGHRNNNNINNNNNNNNNVSGGASFSVGGVDCDFCSRSRMADDVFGRITGRHSFTAANVAKLSRWHGLVVTYVHNPLAFTRDVIADVLDVSHQWFRRAHHEDPRHAFPNIICDIGRRASASQEHLHLQTVLTRGRHVAGVDQWMRAAANSANANNGNGNNGDNGDNGDNEGKSSGGKSAKYWADFVRAHDAVGLAVRVGSSVVLSSACPRKERELIVLADDPEDSSFAMAVAVALTTLRDAAGVRSMSFALTFPPLDEAGRYRVGEEPALLRVIDRGDPLDPRADTGALEYFGTTYVAADPFDIVPHLIRARDTAHAHINSP